jgi:hypothetical protein
VVDLAPDGGDPIEPPSGTLAWPLRRLFGSLVTARGRFRVELELTPWSDQRSEIGIRPIGRWPPVVLAPERYYVLAEQALIAVAHEMVERDRAAPARAS